MRMRNQSPKQDYPANEIMCGNYMAPKGVFLAYIFNDFFTVVSWHQGISCPCFRYRYTQIYV